MKLNIAHKPKPRRPTIEERTKAKCDRLRAWHSWFAWYPVRVNDKALVLFEMVERRYSSAWVGPLTGWIHAGKPQYRLAK